MLYLNKIFVIYLKCKNIINQLYLLNLTKKKGEEKKGYNKTIKISKKE